MKTIFFYCNFLCGLQKENSVLIKFLIKITIEFDLILHSWLTIGVCWQQIELIFLSSVVVNVLYWKWNFFFIPVKNLFIVVSPSFWSFRNYLWGNEQHMFERITINSNKKFSIVFILIEDKATNVKCFLKFYRYQILIHYSYIFFHASQDSCLSGVTWAECILQFWSSSVAFSQMIWIIRLT